MSDLVSEYPGWTPTVTGSDVMDDEYDAYGAELERDIGRLRLLRDAQIPGSARWARKQSQIDLLTDRLDELDRRTPALRDMDERVADIERRRAPVAVEVAWRGGLGMRVKWPSATVGMAVLAVLGVVAGWSWIAVLVVALAAIGCGVRVWAAANLRTQAATDLAGLDRELGGLLDRQARLRRGETVDVVQRVYSERTEVEA